MLGFSRFVLAVIGLIAASVMTHSVRAASLEDLYQSQTVVTGTGEVNRQIGFRDCLDKVLVRVSGDQRLPKKTEMEALRGKAGDFVCPLDEAGGQRKRCRQIKGLRQKTQADFVCPLEKGRGNEGFLVFCRPNG